MKSRRVIIFVDELNHWVHYDEACDDEFGDVAFAIPKAVAPMAIERQHRTNIARRHLFAHFISAAWKSFIYSARCCSVSMCSSHHLEKSVLRGQTENDLRMVEERRGVSISAPKTHNAGKTGIPESATNTK